MFGKDENLIATIHAEAETVEVAESQPQDGLQSAYTEGKNVGLGETPKRRERREETDRTTEESPVIETDKPREKITVRREQSLQEALDGTAPPEAEVMELPESLQRFSAAAVLQAAQALGLDENDLLSEEWQAVVADQLDAEAAANPEDEDDEPNPEEAEESEEEKKSEERKPEVKEPFVHAELPPEEVQKYVEATYAKSQQINSPQMTELFTAGLAAALGTPPEQRELLDSVVGLLNYGGTSLVASAVPAMVDEYMQEHFVPNMMRNIGPLLEAYLPGITDAHHSQQARSVWNDVRAEADQFSDLPDFDSKEFSDLRDKIRKENSWIDTWSGGKDLTPQQDLRARAQLFARLAAGDRVNPKAIAAQIADALQVGKRSAEKSSRRVSANRMLGRGKSSGSFGVQEERAGLMDAWNAHNGRGKDGI